MSTEKGVASAKPTKGAARPQTPAPARPGGDGFVQKTSKYLSEVRTELKKTTWPTREEVIAQTQLVLALLAVVGVFIWAWDTLLAQIFALLLRLMGVNPTS